MEEEKNIMEQPENEQVEVADANNEESQFEIDEIIEKSATKDDLDGSITKFKNTEGLINAYNNLQAEFTRKCQRLAELEHQQVVSPKISFETENEIVDYINKSPNLKNSIFECYFASLQNAKTPIVISNDVGSGIPLNAPPKPTNLDEAKDVVSKMFF